MTTASIAKLSALGAVLMIAACAGSDEAPPPVEENVIETVPVETTAPVETPPPAVNTAAPANVAEAAPEVPPEQQVLDDADATGMTARVDRSGDAPPAEQSQPAE